LVTLYDAALMGLLNIKQRCCLRGLTRSQQSSRVILQTYDVTSFKYFFTDNFNATEHAGTSSVPTHSFGFFSIAAYLQPEIQCFDHLSQRENTALFSCAL